MCYPSVLDLHLGSVNVSLKYIGLLIGENSDVKQSLEILAYRPMTFMSPAPGFEPGTYRTRNFLTVRPAKTVKKVAERSEAQ